MMHKTWTNYLKVSDVELGEEFEIYDLCYRNPVYTKLYNHIRTIKEVSISRLIELFENGYNWRSARLKLKKEGLVILIRIKNFGWFEPKTFDDLGSDTKERFKRTQNSFRHIDSIVDGLDIRLVKDYELVIKKEEKIKER